MLFYRKIGDNEADIDAESDGETNYNIHNSLATRHAYQQKNPMEFYDQLGEGIKAMKEAGEENLRR